MPSATPEVTDQIADALGQLKTEFRYQLSARLGSDRCWQMPPLADQEAILLLIPRLRPSERRAVLQRSGAMVAQSTMLPRRAIVEAMAELEPLVCNVA